MMQEIRVAKTKRSLFFKIIFPIICDITNAKKIASITIVAIPIPERNAGLPQNNGSTVQKPNHHGWPYELAPNNVTIVNKNATTAIMLLA
jgi:hypothetical protein